MAQVAAHRAAFEALQTDIVGISFGSPTWVSTWLEITENPFPIWLDPQRRAYQAYGLERSFWASWGPKNLWYYARAIARGQKLQEKRGDTHQLGGNFIVGANGRLALAYRSLDPTDRPTVAQLVAAARAAGTLA